MNKACVIDNIVHQYKFLQDTKVAFFNNLEEVIQNIDPYIKFINESNENLNLSDLNRLFQYELKMVMLLTNVTLITMEFLNHNKPPKFEFSHPLLRDRANESLISPEDRALNILYTHLEQQSSSRTDIPFMRNALEYDRSTHSNRDKRSLNAFEYDTGLASVRRQQLAVNVNNNLVQVNPKTAVITTRQSVTHSRTIECTNPANNTNPFVIMAEQSITESNAVNSETVLRNTSLTKPQIVRTAAVSDMNETDVSSSYNNSIEDIENSSQNSDISTIKENIKKLSAKLARMSSECPSKSIPSLNYVYQLPEKDTSSNSGVVKGEYNLVNISSDDSSQTSLLSFDSLSLTGKSDDSPSASIGSSPKETDVTVSRVTKDVGPNKTNTPPKAKTVQFIEKHESAVKVDSSLYDCTKPIITTEKQKCNAKMESLLIKTHEEAVQDVQKKQECPIKTGSNINEMEEVPETKDEDVSFNWWTPPEQSTDYVSASSTTANLPQSNPVKVEKKVQFTNVTEIISNTPMPTVCQISNSPLSHAQSSSSDSSSDEAALCNSATTAASLTEINPVQVAKKVQTNVNEVISSTAVSQVGQIPNSLVSGNEPPSSSSAISKLQNKLKVEVARKRQQDDEKVLPGLILLPEEQPSVIRNDLDSPSKRKKKAKPKEKECNDKINGLKKAVTPVVGNWCIFVHIDSPFEFYIHLVSEETIALDELTDRVNKMYRGTRSTYSSKSEAMADVGQVCCAYIGSRPGWFRVRILVWLPAHDTNLIVQAVDCGFKCTVSFLMLRKITKDLAEIPMLAVRCQFPLLYPPGSTYKLRLTEWPETTTICLREMCGLTDDNAEYNFKLFNITFAQQIDDSVAIDMYSVDDGSETLTVGQRLIDLSLAVQISDEYEEELATLEDFLDDIDDMERPDNITEGLLGYDARDEARICPFTQRNGRCFKGNRCKLEHQPFSKDGFTTDKVPVFCKSMNELLVPKKGEICQILVTEALDSCTFYAQIVRTEYKTNKYVMDKDFYELLETMNHKKNISNYKQFKVWPAIGEVVIAKHISKKWLRGVIKDFICEKGEPSLAQVYLVDFGELINLPLSDLREMKECYLQLPFQLVHMYLYNYQQRTDCDLRKSQAFFRKYICRCNFLAEIMSDNPPYRVKLTTFKGNDIGITLEKEGFAKKRTSDIFISDDTIVLVE